MTRLEPPGWTPPYTRGALISLLTMAAGTLAAAVLILARYGWTPGPDRVVAARVLIGVMALGAVTFVASACLVYARTRTQVQFDGTGVRLTRPSGAWSGPWSRIRRAYLNRRLLVIEPVDQRWRGWTIAVRDDQLLVIRQFSSHLGPGVWLDEAESERLVARRRTLALSLGVAGAALVAWVTWPVLNLR